MKSLIITVSLSTILFAELNTTENKAKDLNSILENNTSKKTQSKIEQNIQKEIEKEKIYKKEQKFYQGDDYNLTEHEVDKSSLDKIEVIEPDYDFEMLEF